MNLKIKTLSYVLPIIFVCTCPHAADFAKLGKAAVLDKLKDPGSAQFKSAFVNGISYCGEVNAKNSYGGYNGFKRFVALHGIATIEDPADISGSFENVWRDSCWPAGRLSAYHKEKAAQDAAYTAEIERQRAEIRKQAEEREQERIKEEPK